MRLELLTITLPRSGVVPEYTHDTTEHSSLCNKMHLSNGEHFVRFGGVSEMPSNGKMNGNGISKQQQNGSTCNTIKQENGRVPKSNETHVSVPENQTPDEVLDTVLTAWAILIQRYQRDTFHHFTWRTDDTAADSAQCISTAELGIATHQKAGGLSSKLSSMRDNKYAINQGSTIILNDGTQAEVCPTK
jgi:fusarinine C synthase